MLRVSRLLCRGFAERPSAKKAAKGPQKDAASAAPVKVVELPEVGQPLPNVNVFLGRQDPIRLPDSEYPEWMWEAVGPCRAALKAQSVASLPKPPTLPSQAQQWRLDNRRKIRMSNNAPKGRN